MTEKDYWDRVNEMVREAGTNPIEDESPPVPVTIGPVPAIKEGEQDGGPGLNVYASFEDTLVTLIDRQTRLLGKIEQHLRPARHDSVPGVDAAKMIEALRDIADACDELSHKVMSHEVRCNVNRIGNAARLALGKSDE